MAELKVGILGCGRMGRERARCAKASGAEVAAVFDIDPARSVLLADMYGAQALSRAAQFFDLGLDALFVCTAPGLRGLAERECIHAGLPFYVEKPVGVSVDASQEIMFGLRDRPVVNGVGYMNRYRRSVQLAKESLKASEIVGFSAHWVGKRYNVPWWEVEQYSGGPHNEQATHLFDLFRFLIGEVLSVKSIFRGNSRVSTALECTGDVPGTAFYSCDGNGKEIGLRVFTRSGTVALSGWDFRLTENSVDGQLAGVDPEDIFLIETGTFLNAVLHGDQTRVKSDIADAIKTQAVMDAVQRSGLLTETIEIRAEEWNAIL